MTVDSPPVMLVKATFQNHWIIAAVIFWLTDLFGVLIPPLLSTWNEVWGVQHNKT